MLRLWHRMRQNPRNIAFKKKNKGGGEVYDADKEPLKIVL